MYESYLTSCRWKREKSFDKQAKSSKTANAVR